MIIIKKKKSKKLNETNLSNLSVIVQGLAGEEVYGRDLPEHPPPRTVRCEHQALVVVRNVLRAGAGRPVQELGVVDLQELGRHRRRCRHRHVHQAQTEVHQWAVLLSQPC